MQLTESVVPFDVCVDWEFAFAGLFATCAAQTLHASLLDLFGRYTGHLLSSNASPPKIGGLRAFVQVVAIPSDLTPGGTMSAPILPERIRDPLCQTTGQPRFRKCPSATAALAPGTRPRSSERRLLVPSELLAGFPSAHSNLESLGPPPPNRPVGCGRAILCNHPSS